MKKLHRMRNITIYLPNNYKTSGKRYPVLYINDGQNAFFDNTSYQGISWGFYDYVKKHHLDIIMVAIPCNFKGHKREDEYGPWRISEEITLQETGDTKPIGGEGDKYLEFIMYQLKPYLDRHYPTDPEDTAMVGSSMGGIITAYAALKYPEVFKKCAALSTAFWFYMDEFEQLIQETDVSKLGKFYFDLGGNEGNGDEYINQLYIESNEYIESLLRQKDAKFEVAFYPEAFHHEEQWRKRVPIFMDYFYNSENLS